MGETKHTPGPWVVEIDKRTWGWVEVAGPSFRAGGPTQATDLTPADEAQRIADARLIAAAPDLLEAAHDALAGWRYIREHHGDLYGVGWDRVEAALADAIAKAEGEQ
jgi:hypothetical protein